MLKIIGILLTIVAFSCTGFSYAKNITTRIEQLNEIKKLTVMLEGELRYGNSTIEEAISAIAKRTSLPFAEFLNNVAGELNKNTGKSFSEIWHENTGKLIENTKLNKDDIAEFSSLGSNLGYLDLKAQSESISLYKERLSLRLDELNEGAEKKVKMYRSLGVSMGILTAIILL